MPIQEQMIAEIAREVVARLRVQMQAPVAIAAQIPQAAPGHDGVFATVDEAVNAAYEAQKKVAAMSFDERKRMTDIDCAASATTAAKSWAAWRWTRPRSGGWTTRF
jgi:hypothetical protein